MKAKELLNLGFKQGPIIGKLIKACDRAKAHGQAAAEVRHTVNVLFTIPETLRFDDIFGEPARMHFDALHPELAESRYKFEKKPFEVFGRELIDPNALDQMQYAMNLPISVVGATMPDAHLGYGLPIGGVLATEGAVIPFAVGVDIACRMMLTVLPCPVLDLKKKRNIFADAVEDNTRFGIGQEFSKPHDHEVMDADWGITDITRQLRDKAGRQLGTSGSGNHFVDVGEIEFAKPFGDVKEGKYVAILSHSGSRGAGAQTADFYSKLAERLHPDLPPEYRRLAWLEMGKEGDEYWAAMQLIGRYAQANHQIIHRSICRALKMEPLLQVENHHNFAWKEIHGGRELIVHRKGATPAGEGVLGIIPGSMASPGYLVSGLGNVRSLSSASHGAGRAMSRKATRDSNTWSQVKGVLKERQVELLSAGLDEVPNAYKNILDVMKAQTDLVKIIAEFNPRIVKMAGEGEPAED